MSKTNKQIVAVGAIIIFALLGLVGYSANNKQSGSAGGNPLTVNTNAAKLTSSNDKKIFYYQGQNGQTALAILKSLATVKTKQSSFGAFVVGINGVEADGSKQFWAFYVDGKQASEGAGTYKTKDGQQIMWKVEKVQ